MRIVPGFTGVSTLSPSGLSSRISIVGCCHSNRALTAPQIDIHQLWPRRDARCGLRSSVPHVPCSGLEHHGEYPESHVACALKIARPARLASRSSSEKRTPLAEILRVCTRHVAFARGEHYRQCKRETDSASHFWPPRGCDRTGGRMGRFWLGKTHKMCLPDLDQMSM